MAEKTYFEMFEELYDGFQLEKRGFVNTNESMKIANILGLVGRSRIDCENVKQFGTLLFEHKITPIYNQIDKLADGDHIKNRQEFDELMNKRDKIRQIHDAIDAVVENWIYQMKD